MNRLSTCTDGCSVGAHSGSCRAKQQRARAKAPDAHAHAHAHAPKPEAHAHAEERTHEAHAPVRTVPICGHCLEPVPIAAMTCCQACSTAGKGRVSESRKAELGIGHHHQPPVTDVIDGVCSHCGGLGCRACSVVCQHVQQAELGGKGIKVNTGPWIPAHALVKGQVNRVALPGDADYA